MSEKLIELVVAIRGIEVGLSRIEMHDDIDARVKLGLETRNLLDALSGISNHEYEFVWAEMEKGHGDMPETMVLTGRDCNDNLFSVRVTASLTGPCIYATFKSVQENNASPDFELENYLENLLS